MFTFLVRQIAHWYFLSLEDPTIVGENDKARTNKDLPPCATGLTLA